MDFARLWEIIGPKYRAQGVTGLKRGKANNSTLVERLQHKIPGEDYMVLSDIDAAIQTLEGADIFASYKCCVSYPDQSAITVIYRRNHAKHYLIIAGVDAVGKDDHPSLVERFKDGCRYCMPELSFHKSY